jgi:uncharacterized membrane protein
VATETTYNGSITDSAYTGSNTDQVNQSTVKGARALGWFSIGLGAAELFAPGLIGQMIGIRGKETLIRSMGIREIAAGIAVLTEKVPTRSMMSRVAGDAVDLALLGAGLTSPDAEKGKVGTAIGVVAGITALDVICVSQLQSPSSPISTVQTIAVNKTPEECYQFWRNFENLPRFMAHVESVKAMGDGRYHWSVKAPAGTTVEWDAELTQDSPNRIAWQSLPGADVVNSGTVEFQKAPAGHGTIVKATIHYTPPGGQLGSAIAKLFGEEPSIQAKMDLRRFKAVIETGEVPTTEGQSSGRES